MDEEKFSAEESLALIRSMVSKAQNSVCDDSFYFLLWGWLVFVASIIQYVLKVWVHTPYHYVAWYLMAVGAVVSAWYGFRENRNRKVKTYVEEVLDNLWISIFFCYVLLVILFARTSWENCTAVFIMLYALGNFVSGRALKFPPLIWGAAFSWVLAVIAVFTPFDVDILLGALAVVCSNIIPGFLLRQKYKKIQIDVQRP